MLSRDKLKTMETTTKDDPEDSWNDGWPEETNEVVEPLMLFGGFFDNEKVRVKERVIVYLLQKFFEDRDPDESRYRLALANLVEVGVLSMESFKSFAHQSSSSLAKDIQLTPKAGDQEPQPAGALVTVPRAKPEEGADLLAGRFLSDFKPISVLGSGGFGTVYKSRHNIDGKFYAVKQIPFETNSQSNVLEDAVFREAKALAQMDNPFICRYYNAWVEKGYHPLKGASVPAELQHSQSKGVSEDPGRALVQLSDFHADAGRIAQFWATVKLRRTLYLQMEYCGDTTLADYLTRPEKSYGLFAQVVAGVYYIHSNGFIHRDLKPENIFVSEEGLAKIGDFGLAKSENQRGGPSLDLEIRHSIGIGTMGYTAPECEISGDYNQKADIYSLGIMLWEILCGGFEYAQERQAELTNFLKTLEINPKVATRDPEGAELCLRMISKDPERRPTVAQVMNTSWFQVHWRNFTDAKKENYRTPLLESSSPTSVESPQKATDGERSNESLIQELKLMKQRSLKIEKELQKRETLEEITDDNKENTPTKKE